MAFKDVDLRHRVNIQDVTYTQNPDTGEMTPTWTTTHSTIPCGIEPLSAREFIQSKAMQSETSVRITLRHRDGLTSQQRYVGVCGCHSGRIYNPQGVLEDTKSGRHYVTVPCSEGVNEG